MTDLRITRYNGYTAINALKRSGTLFLERHEGLFDRLADGPMRRTSLCVSSHRTEKLLKYIEACNLSCEIVRGR